MQQSKERTGVLLMAYGTPENPDQVEEYFTHIRGGRKPSTESIEHLKERYRRVGGGTPLLEITAAVARKLEERLNAETTDESRSERVGGSAESYRVYFGMKHWHPFIGEVLERMAADGITSVIALALAPHYSQISIGGYRKAVDEALERLRQPHPFGVVLVESWGERPEFVRMMADLVSEGLTQFPEGVRDRVVVVFSAHSLPERIRTWNDPYERQLLDSSALVAKEAGVGDWRFAFQSAGGTGEPWIGPDILEYLETLHREGVRYVLQVPIGFVSDHLEILFDIDVEAMEKAAELGMTLHRTRLPNVRDSFIDVLASIILEQAVTEGAVLSAASDTDTGG